VSREPDVIGNHGRAWKKRRGPANVPQTHCLAAWLVQHEGRDFKKGTYGVSLVSLDGGGKKVYPKATHELQIVPVRDDANPDAAYWPLSGEPEFVVQFHGLPEPAAAAIPHVVANTCIKGGLAPVRARTTEWAAILIALFERLGGSAPRFVR
jgi:hypothetical protein